MATETKMTDVTAMTDSELDALLGYSPSCSEICERYATGARAREEASDGLRRVMNRIRAAARR